LLGPSVRSLLVECVAFLMASRGISLFLAALVGAQLSKLGGAVREMEAELEDLLAVGGAEEEGREEEGTEDEGAEWDGQVCQVHSCFVADGGVKPLGVTPGTSRWDCLTQCSHCKYFMFTRSRHCVFFGDVLDSSNTQTTYNSNIYQVSGCQSGIFKCGLQAPLSTPTPTPTPTPPASSLLTHGTYTAISATGYGRPASELKPGSEFGLLGNFWKELAVEVDFGVHTHLTAVVNHFGEDATIEVSEDGVAWTMAATLPHGRTEVDITSAHVMLRWQETSIRLNGNGKRLEFHGYQAPGAPMSFQPVQVNTATR